MEERNNQQVTSARPGFTLIELLVVVAIIAVLIAILVPALGWAKDQAKTAHCLSSLKQMANAGATYTTENDGYLFPNNWSAWSVVGVGAGPAKDVRSVLSTYLNMPDWMKSQPHRFNIWTCPSIKVDIKGDNTQQWPITYGTNCMVHPRLSYDPSIWGQATKPRLVKVTEITRTSEIISVADTAQLTTGTSQGFIDGTNVTGGSVWPASAWWNSQADADKNATPPGEPTLALTNRDFITSRVRYRHAGNGSTNACFLDGHAETIKFAIKGRNLSPRY